MLPILFSYAEEHTKIVNNLVNTFSSLKTVAKYWRKLSKKPIKLPKSQNQKNPGESQISYINDTATEEFLKKKFSIVFYAVKSVTQFTYVEKIAEIVDLSNMRATFRKSNNYFYIYLHPKK